MAKCKETGKQLPPNLYSYYYKGKYLYRYRKPSGSWINLRMSYDEAVAKAEQANQYRDLIPVTSKTLAYWCQEFITYNEQRDPRVKNKQSWTNRKRYLERFVQAHPRLNLKKVTPMDVADFWEALTPHAQHNARPVLSLFFSFMLAKGVTNHNPFTTNDAEARVLKKGKPAKQRLPIHIHEFWKVYDQAPEFVQLGMLISLTTTMRVGDVVKLRFDQIQEGHLRVTIGKSEEQRGFYKASHLSWDLQEHSLLRHAITQAKAHSLRLMRCPYIVAAKRQDRPRTGKFTHKYQLSSEYLSKQFTKARDKTGLWKQIPEHRNPPSFHEIRGLAIERMLAANAETSLVSQLAAHTDESTTISYTAQHEPTYKSVVVVSPVELPKHGG